MNSVDLKYDLLHLGLLILAFGGPIAAYRLLRRWIKGRNGIIRTAPGAVAALVALTISPAAIVLTVCSGPPPGQGARAERGYQRAVPVIRALEEYRVRHGTYPEDLHILVPTLLPPEALVPPAQSLESYSFEYERRGADYALTFRYVGPGMNRCTYLGTNQRWSCSGYF